MKSNNKDRIAELEIEITRLKESLENMISNHLKNMSQFPICRKQAE